jgi:hypothetical protein
MPLIGASPSLVGWSTIRQPDSQRHLSAQSTQAENYRPDIIEVG